MRGVRMAIIAAALVAGLGLLPRSMSGQVVTIGTGATGSWVDGGWAGWWFRSFVVPQNARALTSFQVWVHGGLGDVTTAVYPSTAGLEGPGGFGHYDVFYGDGFPHLNPAIQVKPGDTWTFFLQYIDCLDGNSCWEEGDPDCLYPLRCHETRELVWSYRPMILVADDGGLAYTATFTTTTPEPTALLLFGPAAAGLAALRRRRRRTRRGNVMRG